MGLKGRYRNDLLSTIKSQMGKWGTLLPQALYSYATGGGGGGITNYEAMFEHFIKSTDYRDTL